MHERKFVIASPRKSVYVKKQLHNDTGVRASRAEIEAVLPLLTVNLIWIMPA